MSPCSNTEAGPGVRVVCVVPPCEAFLGRKRGGRRFGQRRSERQSGAYVWTFGRGLCLLGPWSAVAAPLAGLGGVW